MKKVKSQKSVTKPLPAVGSDVERSALIGGVGNTAKNATKSYGKGK